MTHSEAAADPKAVFGHNPKNYNQTRLDYPEEYVREVLRSTVPGVKEPTVVDIGAGTGKLSKTLADLGCNVICVEPNEKLCDFLREQFKGDSRFTVVQGTSDNTNITTGQNADLIVMGDSAHWMDPATSAVEFKRILKPEGKVAVLSRFWSQDSAITHKLHSLLEANVGQYGVSSNQYLRDLGNLSRRKGNNMLAEEQAHWSGYSFVQPYSKDELVNYFRGVSSTTEAVNKNEAEFRERVIEPLWAFAKDNGKLTPDGKLNVVYEVHAMMGDRRKTREEMHSPANQVPSHEPCATR